MRDSLTVDKWQNLEPSKNDFDALLREAEMQASNQWEEDFCKNLRKKYMQWEGALHISPNQLNKLNDIAKEESSDN